MRVAEIVQDARIGLVRRKAEYRDRLAIASGHGQVAAGFIDAVVVDHAALGIDAFLLLLAPGLAFRTRRYVIATAAAVSTTAAAAATATASGKCRRREKRHRQERHSGKFHQPELHLSTSSNAPRQNTNVSQRWFRPSPSEPRQPSRDLSRRAAIGSGFCRSACQSTARYNSTICSRRESCEPRLWLS